MPLTLSILLLSLLPFILAEAYSNSTHRLYKRDSVKGPVIRVDFPDPSIIWVPSEKLWFAFATNLNDNGPNVQMATSPDFNTWTVTDDSPLPTVGGWASAGVVTPMVMQLNDGSFVMYYAAPAGKKQPYCVGVATSKTVRGPYTPHSKSFACPSDQGGAIDPAGHQHPDGNSFYVVYTVDGSARGHGGSCNNGNPPIQPTPFMLQQVASDGFTKIGDEIQILDRDESDGPLIAGPSLINVNGTFFLFYSSGCHKDTTYDLRYATATSVTGPYVKAPVAPLLATGKDGLEAPGSACVTKDGSRMVFDAWLGDNINTGRGMWTAIPSFSGTTVTLLNNLPSTSRSASSTTIPSSSSPSVLNTSPTSISTTAPHANIPSSISISASSAISAPSAISSISTSAPSASLTSSSTKPQTGAIAGVVVGGIIALLLLVVALFLFWRRYRRAELNKFPPNPFPGKSQSSGYNGAPYPKHLSLNTMSSSTATDSRTSLSVYTKGPFAAPSSSGMSAFPASVTSANISAMNSSLLFQELERQIQQFDQLRNVKGS